MIKAEARLVEDPAYVLAIYGRLAAKYAMVGPAPVELSDEDLEAAFGPVSRRRTQPSSWNR